LIISRFELLQNTKKIGLLKVFDLTFYIELALFRVKLILVLSHRKIYWW